MSDYYINAVTRRVVFDGSSGVGPYAFGFEVLEETDIAVYLNANKLILTTDYTVTINANGTGSVTLNSAATASDQITIIGARAIERVTDFVTAGQLRASALNEQFDSLTIVSQQLSEENQRVLRAPVYDPAYVLDGGTVDLTLPPVASRANKLLAFDSDGNPVSSEGVTVTDLTLDNLTALTITTTSTDPSSIRYLRVNNNMSVGTSDPLYYGTGSNSLLIDAVYYPILAFTNNASGTTISDGTILGLDVFGGFYISSQEAQNSYWIVNGNQAITIKSDGKVGISNTNPAEALSVTGNISVSGTVDGRDVATDGTKLDGIEAGATADQTGAEIATALSGQTVTGLTSLTTTGAVTIGGDLTVNGTTTTINSTTLTIDDKNIVLASGAADAAAANGAGITIDGANHSLEYDSTYDEFNLDTGLHVTSGYVMVGDQDTEYYSNTVTTFNGVRLNADGAIDLKRHADVPIRANRSGAYGAWVELYSSGNKYGALTHSGSNLIIEGGDSINGYGQLTIDTAGVDVSGNITVSGTVDGRDVAADGTKLDGIESGATADMTASEILTELLTVDGSGSGLDADTVDGYNSTDFVFRALNQIIDAQKTFRYNLGSVVIISGTNDVKLEIKDSSNPYFQWKEGTTNKATTGWDSAGASFNITNQADGSVLRIKDDVDFSLDGVTYYSIFHEGNDGAGSGLDADLLDGQQGSYYLDYTNFTNTPTNVSTFTNDAGYLTSYTETDPVFLASAAGGITAGDITNWDTAYGWGDHSTAGYLDTATGGTVNGDLRVTSDLAVGTSGTLSYGTGSNSILVDATYYPILAFTNNASGTTTADGAILGLDLNGGFYIDSREAQSNSWTVNSNQAITILSDGKVGISDTTPTEALSVGGNISLGDNNKVIFGAGSDLQIYHDGSNNYIKGTGGSDIIIEGGAGVDLYFGNGVRLETGTGGVTTHDGLFVTSQNPSGPLFRFIRNDTTITTNDVIGNIEFYQNDPTAPGAGVVASIKSLNKNSSAGTGSLIFGTGSAASVADRILIEPWGDIAFYDATGTSQDFFWDASASSLGLAKEISFTNTANTSGFDIGLVGGGADATAFIYQRANDSIRFGSNNILRAEIAASGDISFYDDTGASKDFHWDASASRLGLGTTAPARQLTIQDTSAQMSLLSDTTGSSVLNLGDTDDDNIGRIAYNNSNNSMTFRTNTSDALTIDASGNITVSGTVDGRDIAADGTKLDGIEAGATADMTAAEILTAIKTVDGAGSGLDADLLDGVTSASFLRSDANDTFTGTLTGQYIHIDGGGPNYIRFLDSGVTTTAIDLVYRTSPNTLGFEKSTDGTNLWETDCDTGVTNFSYNPTVSGNTIWHAGNDGSGSGLDADTVDGIQASSFLRSDASDTATGDITISKASAKLRLYDSTGTSGNNPFIEFDTTANQGVAIELNVYDGELPEAGYGLVVRESTTNTQWPTTGNLTFNVLGEIYAGSESLSTVNKVWHAGNDGSGSGLDADTLDGVQGSSYLRSDASDTFTSLSGTSITLGSGVTLSESTDRPDLLEITSTTSTWAGLQIRNSSNEGRWSFMTDGAGAGLYDDENGDWHIFMVENSGVEIRYNSVTKLQTVAGGVDVTGDLTATGNVNAQSDARLKENVETLDGSKVFDMRGVSFTRDGKPSSGVIAQELQQVAPELVDDTGEYLSVAYGNLVGYLIEAVKELKAEVEELKNGR